jgi:hypothetical protein
MTAFTAAISPLAGMTHCPAAGQADASSAPAGAASAAVQRTQDRTAVAILHAGVCGAALHSIGLFPFILHTLDFGRPWSPCTLENFLFFRRLLKIARQNILFCRWRSRERRKYLIG